MAGVQTHSSEALPSLKLVLTLTMATLRVNARITTSTCILFKATFLPSKSKLLYLSHFIFESLRDHSDLAAIP